ncbi:MAG TPA: helix-turn-helix domain-containing protein [Acidimicrobiales bacterium]|nr:helix-turn-helix domain-containing protein [Acidimicrobiales bacterium]
MTDKTGQLRFPELVDIETLAPLLGVGERHIRRLVAERRIPYVKWGHLIRFDLEEVLEWLEAARRPARRESIR